MANRGAKRPRLLYVEWDDSSSTGGVWSRDSELRQSQPMRCHTVGWVVHETDRLMTLASSWAKSGTGSRYYSGDMTIPKSVIRKKRRL